MSNAQHTPGPWRITSREPIRIAADGQRIALVPQNYIAEDGSETYTPEMRANARLIAAAPEMLARLQEVEYALSKYPEHSEYGDAGVPSMLLQSIRTAIAKATTGGAA